MAPEEADRSATSPVRRATIAVLGATGRQGGAVARRLLADGWHVRALTRDKAFYPPVSTWHIMPKLLGGETLVPWTAVDDLGVVAAAVFAEPGRFARPDAEWAHQRSPS